MSADRFIVDSNVLERQAHGVYGTHTVVLAADYERDVAAAEERGWDAALEAVEDAVSAERDRWLQAAAAIRDFDSDTAMTCRAYAESHAADLAIITALRKDTGREVDATWL